MCYLAEGFHRNARRVLIGEAGVLHRDTTTATEVHSVSKVPIEHKPALLPRAPRRALPQIAACERLRAHAQKLELVATHALA